MAGGSKKKPKSGLARKSIEKYKGPTIESVQSRIAHYLNSPRLFLEEFGWIKTSDTGPYSSSIIPFKFNNIQIEYYNLLVDLYLKPYGNRVRFQGIRETMMKSRQFGGSTLIQGLFFHDTFTFDGTETWVYCQDAFFGAEMLKKPKLLWSGMTDEFRPEIDINNARSFGSTKKQSFINIGTPGVGENTSRKQGRSLNMRNLHASEMSDWPNAKMVMQGLQESVPDSGNVFREFSPRRMGDYAHTEYQNGLAKVTNRVYSSRFFPWFMFDNYQRQLDVTYEEFAAGLTKAELKLIEIYDLSFEQICWRRHKIAEKGFDIFAFLQEFPEDDVSCLQTTGQIIFPEEVRVIRTVSRPAIPGHIHAIGVDTSNGTEDGSESAIVVIDVTTLEEVYSWSGAIDPSTLAFEVYELWKQYPGLVGIEVNNMGIATVKTAFSIQDWQDPFPGFLYANNSMGGWQTNGVSKPLGIYMLKRTLLEYHNTGVGLRLSSKAIVEQLGWFQHLKNGKMGATGEVFNGKKLRDDLVMALMIAYNIIPSIIEIAGPFSERFGELANYDASRRYQETESKIIVPKIFFEERNE